MRLRNTILMTAGVLFAASSAKSARMCMPCPLGTYSDSGTGGGCKPCAVGTYQNEMGKGSCIPCPAGEYQNRTGETNCKACTGNQYQDTDNQTSCKTCGSGFVTEGGIANTKCCALNNGVCLTGNVRDNRPGGVSIQGTCFGGSGQQAKGSSSSSGLHCNCRGVTSNGAVSSWVYIGAINGYDYNIPLCTYYCGSSCVGSVSSWGGGALW
jgi:hypothetical protein